eukprot:TRINITY_DN7700_c0_g1_i2.p1 TRINITY_DN7700_c0_g1~~TRINITY_DN7700_c0_g1_i2.p1  ORF type:complete len:158 (+),score=45.61 TRINITY_DN7700_c0_g1_i2:192-665(+)
MLFKKVVDVAVHMESFKNIDLTQQGVYQLHLRLFYKAFNGTNVIPPLMLKVYAMPYYLNETLKPQTSKHVDFHSLVPAHILEGLYTFCTRSFLVRYSEEEVALNYIVQFRTVLDTPMPKNGLPFFLEAELLFSDFSSLSGPKRIIGLTATQVRVGVG